MKSLDVFTEVFAELKVEFVLTRFLHRTASRERASVGILENRGAELFVHEDRRFITRNPNAMAF